MVSDHHGPRPQTPVTPKARELGRNFLAALFMAARTAQIHDPSNQAFEQAVQAVSKASQALLRVTGGFSIKFVDDSVFLNGARLRFEGGTYSSALTLRQILADRGLGGLELHTSPSPAALRELVMLFAPQTLDDPRATAEAFAGEIGMLGVQRLQDQRGDVRVDRRLMVVQSYGKLILALRERLERIRRRRAGNEPLGPPRLKPVRVVQDLVELCEDRSDFLLRLSTNRQGAPINELFGVNVSLLSLVLGHTIGLPRQDLVDVGLAALFVPIGFDLGAEASATRPDRGHANAAVARLLADSGVGASTYLRCIVLGEQCGLDNINIGAPLHPYAEMVRCAFAYQQLVLGLSGEAPLHPLAALARLNNDRDVGVDRRWVDLLINVLRAFPRGAAVLLDDGSTAEVLSQIGGTRWDRPMVRVFGPPIVTHDLMIQDDGRFVQRIRGTTFYWGRASAPPDHLEEESPALDTTFDEPPSFDPLSEDDLAALVGAVRPPDDEAEIEEVSEGADHPQLPLLAPADLDEHWREDTEVWPTLAERPTSSPQTAPSLPANALTELPAGEDDAHDFAADEALLDLLDATRSRDFDSTKTQESAAPVDWDE